MRAFHYFIALWTAVAVYGILSFLTGAAGFFPYQQLQADRDRQWDNMKALRLINEDLENTKNSLLYDRDAVMVHARELGYGKKDERFVRIVGLGGEKNPHASPGRIFRAGKPDSVSDRTIKIAALCAGLAVFALLSIAGIARDRQDRL
jgi:cell division protein FtsB